MSLADYLAKNYLTADNPSEKKGKKRKRRVPAESSGILIAEDDVLGWNTNNTNDGEDDGPLTVSSRSAEFRKSKKSNWKAVGAPAPSDAEQQAADAIIASAAAEKAARRKDNDAAPEVVGGEQGEAAAAVVAMMEDGAHAGLQTGAQVAAAIKKREAEERRRFEAIGDMASGKGQETIYRDASGRIVNVAMKRAEARRQAEEAERKKAEEKEAAKGDVQRAEKEARRAALEEAKLMPIARYADDARLNEELKEREHWDDPAAGFLTKKKEGKSVTGKPLYQGAAAPNRYGIKPGHRWDGVDRGNGFEKEYFAARNRRSNLRDLEYAWQMDE